MRLSLVPRRQDFYGLFAELGDNAQATAELVHQRFSTFPDSTVDQGKVKDLEHEGDRIGPVRRAGAPGPAGLPTAALAQHRLVAAGAHVHPELDGQQVGRRIGAL